MSFKYAAYVIPGLGTLCAAGAVAVVVAARAPLDSNLSLDSETSYDVRIPDNLEPDIKVPTMDQVVEKHLFVPDRKATGQNTFPDLLVKGIYVGAENSAVFSLKYRPEANLRVWQGDVDSVISQITEDRDPRKPIVDFLSEWDIKEITFEGVVVEHIITGEVETYRVDYTPAKHVKDNAEAGYGQGQLAQATPGNAGKNTKTTGQKQMTAGQQRAQSMIQLRNMVQNMTPEQRSRLARRIQGGDQQQGGQQQNNKSNNASKKNTSQKNKSSNRKR